MTSSQVAQQTEVMRMQNTSSITTAIAWCLAWGDQRQPRFAVSVLQQMRQALNDGVDKDLPEEVRRALPLSVASFIKEVEQLETLKFPETLDELKQLTEKHPILWNSKIGLVYGGATKIKQYVFEAANLPDIRGASALLDQINLVDLPVFFNKKPESNLYTVHCQRVKNWLNQNFPNQPNFLDALIPELIIYSTGGNILAFCPAAFVHDLANAIEKRYTEETLTANSCAVGVKFRLLETRFGLLRDNIEETFWLERYHQEYKKNPLVDAYFGEVKHESELGDNFKNRKSFNELTTKLVILFNQRRSGNDTENRPSRRYPPMFETHPYLKRDEGERRSSITQATQIVGQPYFSETSARKRKTGDRAKKGVYKQTEWYQEWESPIIQGWTDRFEYFLQKNPKQYQKYYGVHTPERVEILQSLTHLSKVSNGYVAYIYADGNNMGGYIQNIRTPKKYKEFSEDIDNATKYSVYQALAHNLHPRKLRGVNDSESTLQDGDIIHPFEIITIGGDDIILIVPADKALSIAKMIGEQFEKILLKQVNLVDAEGKNVQIKGEYQIELPPNKCHRYSWQNAEPSQCELSMSSGVLITAYNTPIYYAEKLTYQLLKSAKKYAKKLKKADYCGGTVDFFTMKAVTMISSNIEEFRQQALTKDRGAKLKLYAAPYTLHELEGLIKAIAALKKANFPKSQLYQIRSFLEQGKHTAILNYRYFRVRLKQGQAVLRDDFEEAWCKAKTNEGNLAPWMFESEERIYETIWREIVDLYDFIELADVESPQLSSPEIGL